MKEVPWSSRMGGAGAGGCGAGGGWRRQRPAYQLLLVLLLFTSTSSTSVLAGEPYRTAYACEGTTLSIDCDADHVINVIRANYGRFSITICNAHGNTEWSVNCQSPRTHRVLADRCSGSGSCTMPVNSDLFGDPCPGTHKYIEVHYSCMIATTTTTTSRPRPPWFVSTRSPAWIPPKLNANYTTSTTTVAPTTPTTTTTTTTTTSTTTLAPVTEPHIEDEEEEEVIDTNIPTTLPGAPPSSPAPSTTTTSPSTTSSTSMPAPASSPLPSTQAPPVGPPRTEGDYEAPWCPPSFGRGLYWNWTRGGEVAVQPCPGGASGWARRPCNSANWAGPADLSECRSVWLTTLESRASSSDSLLGVAADLATVTAGKALYGGDLTTTARLLSTLATRMTEHLNTFPDPRQRQAIATEMLQAALSTGSALLATGMAGPWGDLVVHERRLAVTQLMVALEEASFLLADSLPPGIEAAHHKSHVLVSARSTLADGSIVDFPSIQDQTLDWGFVDYVKLPPEAILENSEGGTTKVVFLTYRHLEDLLAPGPEPLGDRGSNVTRLVNSRVVSASLGHGRHIQLPEPVTLSFSLLRQENVTRPICAFWDYTTTDWSDEGCRVVHYNRTHVTCQCDHLTNFAVLMEEGVGGIGEDPEAALRILAYVGCVVSLVCVAGSLLVFSVFRGLASPRTAVHRHVCICLTAAELVFLVGVWRTDVPILCGVIAGILHYTVLSAFAWMFMEGVHVYLSVARAVECDSLRLRWWHHTLAYGLPLLVVAAAALVDPSSYGTEKYCWLRTDNYFVFSLVGPALLLLAAHIALLAAAFIYTCRLSPDDALKTKEMARLASARAWLRGAITLLLLMVLTWTLGLLFLHRPSLPIAAAFCVLNALHGIFIFIYYCIRNQKYLPTLCPIGAVKGSGGTTHHPVGPLLSGATSTMGSGGSLRQGVTGHLPLGALHQSLPRHHTVTHPRTTTTTTATTTNLHHATLNHADEDASYKSFSRDSGHGGSEQEDSPRAGWNNHHHRYSNSLTADLKNAYLAKLNSINAAGGMDGSFSFPNMEGGNKVITVPNSYTTQLSPPIVPPAVAAMLRSNANTARSHSPWNHTYMEIETESDPVYEEIERERWVGRSAVVNGPAGQEAMQVSDLSDEDVKRGTPSDMSRQSSRSYGDARPLLPYNHSPGHHFASRSPQDQQFALSEERLRDFNAAQMSKDLEQLQQAQQQFNRENLMTVAVLNGEQVVCRLTSPSNPQAPQSLPVIHEGNGRGLVSQASPATNGYPAHLVVSRPSHHRPQQYSEC